MSDALKKKLAAVVALLVAGAGLTYVAFGGIEDNLVYYWDPPQLLSKGDTAKGATIRLGGIVQRGSVVWIPQTLALSFNVGMTPEGGPNVAVRAKEAPPQMFQEGMGVVVEGHYDGALFNASRVMVKHSNEYRAPESGERPQDVYKSLITD